MTRPSDGYAVLIEDGRIIGERDTEMCVHCGHHARIKTVKEGWEIRRCTCCDGPVCDKVECRTRCLPLEKRLADMEFRERLRTWM